MSAPNPILFCTPTEQAGWDDAVTVALQKARETVAAGRVAPAADTAVFRDRLSQFDFVEPRSLEQTIGWVINQLNDGLVQITHARYFGLFNPSPCLPAELADRIVAAFNPQLATATTSPAAIELERHVIRAFADRLDFPDGASGHFATGGSEANFTAVICALARANSDFVERGVGAFAGQPVFYVSEDAHLVWYKIAVQCGLGHSAVRQVPTDGAGCMDVAALPTMVAEDRQRKRVPVMVAATAGTTGAGMIDPLGACADAAERAGLWFHVDAAWGGAAVVSDRLRPLLDGIGRADSVTIDAHKWLATTMACSMFLARTPAILQHALRFDSYYMPPSDHQLDPYRSTVQWSRRFLGLRLFLALAAVGWRGLAEHVERSVLLADMLTAALRARNWSVVNDSPLAVVCALPPEGSRPARDIVQAVLASGHAWISCTRFKGRDVLRICPVNGRTTSDDILSLVELLDDVRSTQQDHRPAEPTSWTELKLKQPSHGA